MTSSRTTTFASNDNAPAATDALNRRLYGNPVVVTNSANASEAIIGDFRGSARIFHTGSASVTIHDSQPRDVSGTDYADYRLNQLVLRAEMRAEVAIWRAGRLPRREHRELMNSEMPMPLLGPASRDGVGQASRRAGGYSPPARHHMTGAVELPRKCGEVSRYQMDSGG